MANVVDEQSFSNSDYLNQIRLNFTNRASSYNHGVSGAMHQDIIDSLLFFHPPVMYPVLDIACGTGLLAATLDSDQVVGIDLTPAMLHTAKLTAPKATFVQGVAEQLPFEKETFGTVYTCSALAYFTDIEKVVRNAYAVLKEGGTFAYQAVTLDSYVLGVVLENAVWKVLGEDMGRRVFQLPHALTDTKEANEKLMEQAGFVQIKMNKVTVVSELSVQDAEKSWQAMVEKEDRNALTMRIGDLDEKSLAKVKALYIQMVEERRMETGMLKESVTSWYVAGTKKSNSS